MPLLFSDVSFCSRPFQAIGARARRSQTPATHLHSGSRFYFPHGEAPRRKSCVSPLDRPLKTSLVPSTSSLPSSPLISLSFFPYIYIYLFSSDVLCVFFYTFFCLPSTSGYYFFRHAF